MSSFSTLCVTATIESLVADELVEQTLANKTIGVAMGYEISQAIRTLDADTANELLKKINGIIDVAVEKIHEVLIEVNEEVTSTEEARAAGLE